MKILISESKNKLTREIINLSREEVLCAIETDHNWHEVFEMYSSNTNVRVFFDIDAYIKSEQVLEKTLDLLNTTFKSKNEDWAISCGSRDKKVSYHILSKKYKITLESLRAISAKLKAIYSWFDDTLLYIYLESNHELGFFRLPNQSKDSVNKPAPPMRILQGELSDFLITDIEELELFIFLNNK